MIPNLITVGDEAEAIAARHLRVRYGDVVAHGRDILYPDAEPSHRHDMHCACLDLLSLAGRRLPSPLYERYYLYLWRCFLSDTTYTYGARHLLDPRDDLGAEEEAHAIIVRVSRCCIVAREVGGAAGGT